MLRMLESSFVSNLVLVRCGRIVGAWNKPRRVLWSGLADVRLERMVVMINCVRK